MPLSSARHVMLASGEWSPPPPHVFEGAEFVLKNPYCLIASEMGCMKTAQVIAGAQLLAEAGIIDTVLVLAPASVRPVWVGELGQLFEQLWLPGRITEYHAKDRSWDFKEYPTPSGIRQAEGRPLRWVISNYEYVRRQVNLDALAHGLEGNVLLICDESSALKGYDSLQTKAAFRLRSIAKRVVLLNGTPIADNPGDLFSQANLMHPSILECRYITHFRSRYAVMGPVLGAGGRALVNPRTGRPLEGIKGWQHLDDLEQRLKPYVLRREAKELGIDFALPMVPHDVRLKDPTWKAYREMRDEMVVWLESGEVASARQAAVKSMRLSQITGGFIGGVEDDVVPLGDGPDAGREWDLADLLSAEGDPIPVVGDERPPAVNPGPRATVVEIGREKLDFLLDWQRDLLKKEPNLKLLVWFRFVAELRRYVEAAREFDHPVGAICGQSIFGAPLKVEREGALRLLHPRTAPEGPCSVAATGGTGAMGLNLTACNTVMEYSYDFSNLKKKQGDARVNRPGQTRMVRYYAMVAVGPRGQKTIDAHVLAERTGKGMLADATVAKWVAALKEE